MTKLCCGRVRNINQMKSKEEYLKTDASKSYNSCALQSVIFQQAYIPNLKSFRHYMTKLSSGQAKKCRNEDQGGVNQSKH